MARKDVSTWYFFFQFSELCKWSHKMKSEKCRQVSDILYFCRMCIHSFFYHRQCKHCTSACKCWLIAYFDCVAIILFCCIKNIKGYHVSSHKIQKVDTENIVSAEELFRAYTACSALPHFWDSASQYWSSVCSIGYKQYGVNWLYSLIWYIFFEKKIIVIVCIYILYSAK